MLRTPTTRSLMLRVGLVSLIVHACAASYFVHAGVLQEHNVLFDADPDIYTMSFAANLNRGPYGGRSLVHPNVSNLVFPVVSAVSHIAHHVWPDIGYDTLSSDVAYGVMPVVAAVTTMIVFALFTELGIAPIATMLLALVSSVAFSSLIFGSIPESYGLSALALAILFLLAARVMSHRTPQKMWPWLVAGCFLTGITISNLAIFAILMTVAFIVAGEPWKRAIPRVALACVAVLCITIGLYKVSTIVFTQPVVALDTHLGQMKELTGLDVHKLVVEFPAALANTFVPPTPLAMPYNVGRQAHPYIMTFRAAAGVVPHQWLYAAPFLLVLILCATGVRWMTSPVQRGITLAAVLIILFNWLLHAMYGVELLLYSQHWLLAEVVVLAGALSWPNRWRSAGYSLIAALFLVTLIDSSVVFRRLSEQPVPGEHHEQLQMPDDRP